ncbi:MAG: hypothetical protein QXF61_09235 [Nitrososphaeria archaeon]
MDILNLHKPQQGEVIVILSPGVGIGAIGIIGEFVSEKNEMFVISRPAFLLQGIDPRSGSAIIGILPIPVETSENMLYIKPSGFFRPSQEIYSKYIQTMSNLVIATSVPKNEA